VNLRSKFLIAMALGIFISAGPLLAHHGTAAYDYSKTLTEKATIASFNWANPHCQIEFDFKDETGAAQHWNIEAFNPAMLRRDGWTNGRQSLKPGDDVTISFHPAKNGMKVGILDKVVLADGTVLKQRAAQSQAPY
jgi:hypothetical protein